MTQFDETRSWAALGAFLDLFLEDDAAGRIGSLEHYVALFPGQEAAVADEYRQLVGDQPPTEVARDRDEPIRFSHYRVINELGRGGQGVVYVAEDERLGRRVALKVLPGRLRASRDARLRFEREIAVMSRLDVPGICPIHDAGREGDTAWIAMRLLEGRTLAQLIADRQHAGDAASVSSSSARAKVEELLRIGEKLARTLHVAHESGVVHRDVKPGNVLVAADGEPVLLDFGLARDESDPALTTAGDVFGTPAYMAPEQVRGDRSADRRTDVYGLGATLYECFTLARPFDDPTRVGLFRAILESDPISVRRRDPALPRDLSVVLGTALEKDPARRYQTANDFAEDLRRVRERIPILARPPGRWLELVRWCQRRPVLTTVIGGAVTLLVVALGLTLFFLEKEAVLAGHARRLADLATIDELEAWADRLQPPAPEIVAGSEGMDAWLTAARGLLARRPQHERALQDLRAGGDVRRVRVPFRDAREREKRVAELDVRAAWHRVAPGWLEAIGAPSHSWKVDRNARLAAAIERERERPDEHEEWIFPDRESRWMHDAFVDLLARLEELEDTVRDVTWRRAFARDLVARSIEDQRSAWAETVSAIRDPARAYGGLEIAPQPGLIPLGFDARSGLAEFAHLLSGDPAVRDDRGRLVIRPRTGIVLVLLPGGRFTPGAQREDRSLATWDPLAERYEAPSGEAELAPFFLAKHELSQAQWTRARGDNPSALRVGWTYGLRAVGWTNPVENITWDDAAETMRRLGLVLPTEAQWEWGARAGGHGSWWVGNDKALLQDAENLADATLQRNDFLRSGHYELELDDGYCLHAPAGSFRPNGFGLHDMVGNVGEWVRDRGDYFYRDRPPAAGDGERAQGHTDKRIVRGTSWNGDAAAGRAAARDIVPIGYRSDGIGLRPARPLDP